jgi:hypothetical protein
MSTPSLIAMATARGYRSISCTSDGYPSGVGLVLLQHYRCVRQIRTLLRLGDLSVLGEQLGEKHDFDWVGNVPAGQISSDPRFRMCRAYGRDRGEEGCQARHTQSFDSLVEDAIECGAQWLYVWFAEAWRFAPVKPGLILDHMTVLTAQACQIHS